jgi:hypothetical protein
MHRMQKIGIKPDRIINFLSNEPPFKLTRRLRYRAEAHFEIGVCGFSGKALQNRVF